MTQWVIVDTGPLVAFLDRREAHHDWIAERSQMFTLPWLLCEAVLAESWHLLRRLPGAQDVLLDTAHLIYMLLLTHPTALKV